MKTKISTNLFMLAVAVFFFCTMVSVSTSKQSTFLVGFLITIAVVLAGAVVKAVERNKESV